MARFAPALLCAALIAWSLWQRWSFLDSSPHPFGVDGYYYPIQLRSLLQHGELYYPSAPLALWLMTPLAWFLGDPITGAKLGAALGTSLIIWPVYALGRRVGGTRAAGLLAATLVATSPSSFYFTAEFVKNGIGLTLALGFLCVLARALDEPAASASRQDDRSPPVRWSWLGAAAVSFLAVVMTHKLATVMAVIAALPPMISLAVHRQRPGERPGVERTARISWILPALLVALAILVAILGLVAPRRFASPGDLALVNDLFTTEPSWSLPVLAPPGAAPLTMQGEVAVAALLSLTAIAVWIAGRHRSAPTPGDPRACDRVSDRVWFLGPAALTLGIALPWLAVSEPQGPGFRLRLLTFIALALSAALLAGPVLRRLRALHRGTVVAAFAVALLITRPAQPRDGIARAHPAMVAATQAVSPVVPGDHTIVTPERHILFMIAWYGDREVVLRPEAVSEDERWRVIPMALMTAALRQTIDRARTDAPSGIPPPRGVHPLHRDGLVVMPEITWQWILSRLPTDERAFYRSWKTI